ncbi:MAG TPA: serine protease [Xanthomonadales bacterium]|nr:serine protease [Xanthomonadales bacterium]
MNGRLITAAVLVAFSTTAWSAELRRVANPIEGQYIVVLKEDAQLSAQQRGKAPLDKIAAVAADNGLYADITFENVIQGFVTRTDDAGMRRLMRDSRVAFIEEDGMSYPSVTQTGATWGIDRVDQRDRPLNGTYVYDTGASNVRAYVIDTGILASHTDFGGRVSGGATAISDGRGTSDCNGHGTHVAGTIGGATWGIAKQVRLVPVRVFGCTGGAANSTIVSAMDWVRTNHVKPAVVNMSLGGPAASTIDTAANNLINAGVTLVVAAGNDNQNACNFSPARVANAITVGSTTSTDARSSFSNFGTCLDLFAPGSSITSAWWTSNTATNTISGTSMASPHVAGMAAIVLAGNTGASPATVRSTIVTKATTNRLTSIGTGSPNLLLYTR